MLVVLETLDEDTSITGITVDGRGAVEYIEASPLEEEDSLALEEAGTVVAVLEPLEPLVALPVVSLGRALVVVMGATVLSMPVVTAVASVAVAEEVVLMRNVVDWAVVTSTVVTGVKVPLTAVVILYVHIPM